MNYRTLSSGGCRVSTLALGGNIFGYTCDERQTQEILFAAETIGVNFVDTADVYSDGQSEEILGKALVGRRDRWVIATKVGVRSDGTGNGTGSKKSIYSRIEQSLRRLRTDYVDIYQLHHFDPDTPVLETLEAFEALRVQGKVRHFGISNCTAHQAARFVTAARDSSLPAPATRQMHYNLLKREAEEEFLIPETNEQPRLLVYGVLGRGILSGRYRAGETFSKNSRAALSAHVRSDLQPAVLEAVEGLSKIAWDAGITMSQLAAAYVLRPAAVVAAVIGIRSLDQLTEIARGCTLELSSFQWTTVDGYLHRIGAFDTVSLGRRNLANA